MPKKSSPLDEKDRRILVCLDQDARQTDAQIARKVGLSKQVANYRIQKLFERGIIINFYTLINVGKLGLNTHYIFLQLERINKEEEKALLEKLKSISFVGWLVSGTGRWDVITVIYAESIVTFEQHLNTILNVCSNHVHEYNFTTLIEAEHIRYKFLGDSQKIISAKQREKSKEKELKESDKKILEAMDQNARTSIVEIAQKTKIPMHIVNYHLKNLIKEKIIEGFKPKINVSSLNLQWHLLLIQFQNTTDQRKKEFISFCRQHKKIYYVTNTIGLYNLMLDIHVASSEEFKEMLLELKERFSDIIKLYESFIIFDEYKISYFPKELV